MVPPVGKYPEVGWAIVQTIPIFVVDNMFFLEAKPLGNDIPTSSLSLPGVDIRFPIPGFEKGMKAILRTKVVQLPSKACFSPEDLSATSMARHRVTPFSRVDTSPIKDLPDTLSGDSVLSRECNHGDKIGFEGVDYVNLLIPGQSDSFFHRLRPPVFTDKYTLYTDSCQGESDS